MILRFLVLFLCTTLKATTWFVFTIDGLDSSIQCLQSSAYYRDNGERWIKCETDNDKVFHAPIAKLGDSALMNSLVEFAVDGTLVTPKMRSTGYVINCPVIQELNVVFCRSRKHLLIAQIPKLETMNYFRSGWKSSRAKKFEFSITHEKPGISDIQFSCQRDRGWSPILFTRQRHVLEIYCHSERKRLLQALYRYIWNVHLKTTIVGKERGLVGRNGLVATLSSQSFWAVFAYAWMVDHILVQWGCIWSAKAMNRACRLFLSERTVRPTKNATESTTMNHKARTPATPMSTITITLPPARKMSQKINLKPCS